MRLQVITNLFPLPWEPNRATFNRQQFSNLSVKNRVRVLVVVSWLARLRNLSASLRPCKGDDPEVHYGWYFYVPGVFRASYPFTLLASLLPRFRSVKRFKPDCLLLSWAYPDAVAGALLGLALGIPFVIKVHGSDINVFAGVPSRARQIRWAMKRARAVVSVSRDLARKVEALGIDPGKIHVIYNGVDHGLFRPADRQLARRELGLVPSGKIILYVGNLKEEKGCLELVRAFALVAGQRRDATLYLVGRGPDAGRVAALVDTLELKDRVHLVGGMDHPELPRWFNASDVVTLPSFNEGVPNVLLEAMACGVPVVASRVGGIPEIVPEHGGLLFDPGDTKSLAECLLDALGRPWDANSIAATMNGFDWQENTRRMQQVLESAAFGTSSANTGSGCPA